MKKLLLATLLLTIATSLNAQTWTPLGSHKDGKSYIDLKSAKKVIGDGMIQVWAKVDYDTVRYTESGIKYNQIQRISVYDCPASTRRVVMSIFLFKGKVVDAQRANDGIIIPIEPENTVGKKALELACPYVAQRISLR